jgi:hypothetical protein
MWLMWGVVGGWLFKIFSFVACGVGILVFAGGGI